MNFKSQAGEDKFLLDHFFMGKKNGRYIELGAMDGLYFSNTYYFEKELDWSGILIEPHIYNFDKLKNNRPNNYLFNEVISNIKEPVVFRLFKDNVSGVSGIENTMPHTHFEIFFDSDKFCKENIHNNTNSSCICWWLTQQEQEKQILVPKTLTEIIKSTQIKEFDFLSLDVEGHEFEVLDSWDFSVPINVILIETLGVEPEKELKCRNKLISNNYSFYSKCAHNEVYILNKKP